MFSAGGDLKGMTQQATNTREGRMADATEFAQVLAELNQVPKLLIGRINGSAFGGGLGLISICDIAIGLADATFRLSEVTLGLIPATISPYVVAKIGVPNSRRIMLNAAKLDGPAAARLGLLDVVVPTLAELDEAVEREVASVLQCAAGAVAKAKELIRYVSTARRSAEPGLHGDRPGRRLGNRRNPRRHRRVFQQAQAELAEVGARRLSRNRRCARSGRRGLHVTRGQHRRLRSSGGAEIMQHTTTPPCAIG